MSHLLELLWDTYLIQMGDKMATYEERLAARAQVDNAIKKVDLWFPPRREPNVWTKIVDLWWAIHRGIREFWSALKYWDQRRAKGFADEEWWEFSYHHSKWCLKRLMELRKRFHGMPMRRPFERDENGHPGHYTPEEWKEILGKMCRAFYLVLKRDEDLYVDNDPLTLEYINEGLDLFAKHYLDLWD